MNTLVFIYLLLLELLQDVLCITNVFSAYTHSGFSHVHQHQQRTCGHWHCQAPTMRRSPTWAAPCLASLGSSTWISLGMLSNP